MTLTKRQCAVLWGLAAGLSLQEIAKELEISLATVSGHRSQLGRIYHSRNIIQLLRAAVADKQLPKNVLSLPLAVLMRKMHA